MNVLKSAEKESYMTWVIDNAPAGADLLRPYVAHAFSWPFWTTMKNVADSDCFASLVRQAFEMDIVVVPDSMYESFHAAVLRGEITV